MGRRRKTAPLIAMTIGDPAGIGPEVVLKAAAALSRRDSAPALVAIGDLAAMRDTAARLAGAPRLIEWRLGDNLPANRLPVIALGELAAHARRPGKPTVEGGEASFRYVEAGARMARVGDIDALVTAPISKQWWHRAGHRFPGHSELLAKIARDRKSVV